VNVACIRVSTGEAETVPLDAGPRKIAPCPTQPEDLEHFHSPASRLQDIDVDIILGNAHLLPISDGLHGTPLGVHLAID